MVRPREVAVKNDHVVAVQISGRERDGQEERLDAEPFPAREISRRDDVDEMTTGPQILGPHANGFENGRRRIRGPVNCEPDSETHAGST
jgi:hypothetical protein